MEVADVGSYVGGFSDIVGAVTTLLSRAIAWMFTTRNLIFFGILIAIIFLIYKVWQDDTAKKRYYFNRRREI